MLTFLTKNMEKADIMKLIEACGEIARGLKKTKAILTKALDGLPVVSPGQSVPDLGQSVPKKSDPIKEYCSLPRFSQPKKFLTSRKTVWGKNFARDCVKWLLQKDLRSDKFKNTWLNEVKISQRQYKEILGRCKLFLEDCKTLVLDNWCWTFFAANVGQIHWNRWQRRQNIPDARLTLKVLNAYTQEVHNELPSMRPVRRIKNKTPQNGKNRSDEVPAEHCDQASRRVSETGQNRKNEE